METGPENMEQTRLSRRAALVGGVAMATATALGVGKPEAASAQGVQPTPTKSAADLAEVNLIKAEATARAEAAKKASAPISPPTPSPAATAKPTSTASPDRSGKTGPGTEVILLTAGGLAGVALLASAIKKGLEGRGRQAATTTEAATAPAVVEEKKRWFRWPFGKRQKEEDSEPHGTSGVPPSADGAPATEVSSIQFEDGVEVITLQDGTRVYADGRTISPSALRTEPPPVPEPAAPPESEASPAVQPNEQAYNEIVGLGITIDPTASVDALMQQLTSRGWQANQPTRDHIQSAIDYLRAQAIKYEQSRPLRPPTPPAPGTA